LDNDEPQLRANLARELELLEMDQKISKINTEKMLATQGIELLRARLEKKKLKFQIVRQDLNTQVLLKEDLILQKDLEDLQKTSSVLEQREKEYLDNQRLADLDAKCLAEEVPEIFSVHDNIFRDNLDWLCQGLPVSGLVSMFLPQSLTATHKSWRIKGTGSRFSSFTDCNDVEAQDVDGWQDSMFICELPQDKLASSVEQTWKYWAAASSSSAVLGATCWKMNTGWATALKAVAATSTAVGVATAALVMSSYIKGAKLRAVVMDIVDSKKFPDARPREDLISAGPLLDDRLIKIRLFAELTLMDGSIVLCFDPVALRLFSWTKSNFYALGVLATEDNKTFIDFWISEQQFHTAVSRHSLVVSEFEKSKSVARMTKLLEMTPAFNEAHGIRFQTGEGIFTATLRFATLVVNKDPYRDPSDF